MPRVWDLLLRDLSHPALGGVARSSGACPTPTPDILGRLKEKCATIPTRDALRRGIRHPHGRAHGRPAQADDPGGGPPADRSRAGAWSARSVRAAWSPICTTGPSRWRATLPARGRPVPRDPRDPGYRWRAARRPAASGATTVYTMNTDAAWRGPNPLECLRKGLDARQDGGAPAVRPGGSGRMATPATAISRSPPTVAPAGARAVYCGVQIIATGRLATIGERRFSLNRVWDAMLGTARSLPCPIPGTGPMSATPRVSRRREDAWIGSCLSPPTTPASSPCHRAPISRPRCWKGCGRASPGSRPRRWRGCRSSSTRGARHGACRRSSMPGLPACFRGSVW